MTRKRLGYLVMAFGVVIALATGVVVYQQVVGAESLRAALPTAQVVVATEDIDGRTQIKASQVGFRSVQNELLYAGAATRLEDVVGLFTPAPIVKGEIIGTQRIGKQGTNNAPSVQIEKGKELYAMPLSFGGGPFVIAQINALRPGDRVDVLYTSEAEAEAAPGVPVGGAAVAPHLQTRVLLQNLRIHAMGAFAEDGSSVQAVAAEAGAKSVSVTDKTLIFMLTPEQALVLKWLRDTAAVDKTSVAEMVLRSPTDDTETDPHLVMDLAHLRQTFNLQAPDPRAAAPTAP